MTERSAPHAASQLVPAAGEGVREWQAAPRFIRYLIVGIVGINVLVAVALAYVFADSRRSEELRFREEAANLARLISKDIDSQYARIDLSLRAVADEYANQLAMGGLYFERWMERVRQRHPAVSFMRISDAAGNIVYSPDGQAAARINIADRDYFTRLRADPQAGLQITPPLLGRTTGTRLIILVRRLGAADEHFHGVVLASIPIARLQDMLAGLLPRADSYVGLIDAQYRWVAAQPATAGQQPSLAALRDAAARSPESGLFHSHGDDGERLVAYKRSEAFGFYTVVGLPAGVLLADWRKTAAAGAAGMALFALLTTLLGWLLCRSWKQQSATTARLIERDEWVRQAQQVAGLALFSYDIESQRFAVSDALYAISGTDSEYPHTWPGWLALAHPDDRQALDLAFRRLLRGESDGPAVAYRIVRPADGSLRWVKSVAHLVSAPDATRQTLSGVVLDISAEKRQEDVLAKSEQLFRSVFENSMIGMATTSLEKGWLKINQTLCDILGYEHHELLRMTWADLTHPDDLAADVASFNRVLAGEIDAYELDKRFIRKSGEIVDAYIAARAIRRSDHSIDHFVALVQDITPRKRAEDLLRASEADLSAALDQAAVGIAFVAPDGHWLRVNERLCQLVGYAQAELLTLTFQDITHPDDLELDLAQLARLASGQIDSYTLEKRYFRKDGRCVWINLSVSLIRNGDGTPHHFVSIIEDIDARKTAERDLARSREILKNFLDHLPGMAYVKDQDLRVLHANRGVAEFLNLDPEQVVGRSNAELFPGELGDKISRDDRRVLASGQTEYLEEAYAGGFYQTTRFVVSQGDHSSLLGGITLDITRRHQLEERARALLEINDLGRKLGEKELLAACLEMAEKMTASGIGFLHFVNDDQQTIELSTWTAGALKGCRAMFDNHYPIKEAGIWADCCRQRLAVCFNDYGEYEAKRGLPEGHAPLQRLISVPVIEEGRVRMVVGVGNKAAAYDDFDVETVQLVGNEVWSIRRRAQAEAALAQRLAEVTELNGKLEDAHLQLLQSEKMSAIGQLAAGVAHELNNPIGFVHSNLGTLGEYVEDLLAIDAAFARVEAQLPALAGSGAFDEVRRLKAARDHSYVVEDLPKLIRESKEGLERVRRIVLDLRDFSRVGESEWQWTDLEKGLESTINIVWNELKYKAEVERQYTPLPPIHCLASQLNQVFMNLLVNAAQAIETRGRIVIRTGTGTDADAASTDAASAVDVVWVEIEDSGCGMSPEVQKRLFEPFFTTKPVGKGTGLGLSIAFAIIARHHGRFAVRSEIGHGTTFRITLPIDPSQAATGTE